MYYKELYEGPTECLGYCVTKVQERMYEDLWSDVVYKREVGCTGYSGDRYDDATLVTSLDMSRFYV